MQITLSNFAKIEDATDEIKEYCSRNFWMDNPEYYSKERLGLWVGDTPKKLYLYETDKDAVIVPIGLFDYLKQFFSRFDINKTEIRLADDKRVDFASVDFGLYDYQEKAVAEMINAGYGILHSTAGSGKTQMGLSVAVKLGYKTLWLTHTTDLLRQSYERAAQYLPKNRLGKITAGKVEMNDITFATVQTMSKLDLAAYKFCFNTVIVDECHRVCGSPSRLGQFAKILNSLAARHKYGLSATVHRADGTEKAMFAYLGDVRYSVPDEAVADRVMPVKVKRFGTGIALDPERYTDFDGTIIWSKYISALAEDDKRRLKLVKTIAEQLREGRCVLVLSDRICLLEKLKTMIGGWILTGKTARDNRRTIIEDIKSGRGNLLLSTYSLSKEGLDIPCLDTLVMATPVKDYAVVVQAVGRIARVYKGKKKPLVIDVVDADRKSEQLFKVRCRHYKKEGIEWS